MRPITHCKQEACNHRSEIDVLNNSVPNANERAQLERWSLQSFCEQSEEDVVVGQSKPSESEVDERIERLNDQHDLSRERMTGSDELSGMRQRINGSEEGSIEPTTTLGDLVEGEMIKTKEEESV